MHDPKLRQPEQQAAQNQSAENSSFANVLAPPTFQLKASTAVNAPVQMKSEWEKDSGGNLYYNTKGEAEGRMGKLKKEGKFGEYRVVSFESGGKTYWRVETQANTGDKETSPTEELGDYGVCNEDGTYTNFEPQNLTSPVDNTSTIGYFNPAVDIHGLETCEVEGGNTTAAPTTTSGAATTATTTAVPNAETPATADGKAAFNLGLTGSVGKDMDNKEEDVAKVRGKLVAYGFIAADKTDQASLNSAIEKFQKDVMGLKKPDQQISKGGATDRALTTYYSTVVTDYSSYSTALNDITLTTVQAPTDFATTMSGVTISASSSASNVSIPALIALEDRLLQIKSSYMGSGFSNADLKALKDKSNADLSDAEKEIVKSHIAKAVAGTKAFQANKKVSFWSTKKRNDDKSKYVLTDTATKAAYNNGQMAPDDATYIMLRDMKKFTMSWKQDDGSTKTRTKSNFVKSSVTTYEEGIGDAGTIDPEDYSIDKFKTAGNIDEGRAKSLRHTSQHEGNFDAINSYDRAVISYGFIQFAGGNRSIEYLFARIKSEHPSTWQERFAKYGIDVEYKTNATGAVTQSSCRIVVHDPESQTTLRGMDAEHALKNNPKYAAVLMKAAEDSIVQDMQIAVAVSNYVKPSENSPMNYKVKILKVKNAAGATQKIKADVDAWVYSKKQKKRVWLNEKSEIAAYKQTPEYITANAAGLVEEVEMVDALKNLKLGEIMESEKEHAALYGTYLNSPGTALKAFRSAIIAIIVEKGLTTIDQVKSIDPVELLKKAESTTTNDNHKGRIEEARTDAALSA